MKFVVEIDLTHDRFRSDPVMPLGRYKIVATALREVASRLEEDSYDTIHNGKVYASDYIPRECGSIRVQI